MSDKIGDILLELGYIKEDDIRRALEIQSAEGRRRKLGEILTDFFIKEEDLFKALSVQRGGFKLDTSIEVVSHILKHRLQQEDIRKMLASMSAKGQDAFMSKVAEIFDKITAFIEVSTRLSDTLSLDRLLERMVGVVSDILNADRSTIFLIDRETGELFSRVAEGGLVNEIRFPSHLGIAGSVFTKGEPVIINDAYADPRFNKEVDKKTGYRTRNILCAPIKSRKDEIIGVFQALNKKDGDFSKDDLTLLEALSSQASAALQNAQLYEQIKKAMEEESQLLDVTTAISRELHLQPLLLKIMETATDILDADRSTLFMYDGKTDTLWSVVAQGEDIREIRIPSNRGIAGSVFSTCSLVNIEDAYTDDRFNPEVDKKTGYHTKSILCMPVINKAGQNIGVIQVLNKKGGSFTAVDEKRLKAFSAQASIAIENAKLFDDVLNMKNYNESMLESMSNGMITLDAENKIVKCNEAAVRILNVKADIIAGQKADAFFQSGNGWITDKINNVLKSRAPDIIIDTEYYLTDGKTVSMNMTVVPLINVKKELIGSMIVFEDISQEKRLKGTMARYMTKEVAEKLLESGEAVLGGKLQEATVLFSDIRSFTTISEKLGASETVSMLNDYFTLMVDVIFKYNGILDKYIGDAILAVFGAPFGSGEDEDNAVRAAIGMMRVLGEFNSKRQAEGQEPIDIGIGINTDYVISGNIGSMKRMDYTVIGDGVNLASRLEGANKYYCSRILISEFTKNRLKDAYILREVDRIRVKGKNRPVSVYEVLDYHDEKSFPCLNEAVGIFTSGLELYRRRRWREGQKLFESVLNINANDGLSKIYVERCEHFLNNPPDDSWDGVWTMKSK